MNENTNITPEQLEMLVYQARLETYAALAISMLPLLILTALVFHAFGKTRMTTLSFLVCGLLTFTIPSPLTRASGIAITIAGLLVFIIQWIHSPRPVEADLKTNG